MRDPGPERLRAPPRGQRAQVIVARGSRRLGGDPDAARPVGPSCHPGGELLGPIAREDQMRVAVHEARDHAAAHGVEALVGRCRAALPLHGGHTVTLEDERRVADDAQWPLAEALVVGD
jgi:hypothetical protein